MSQYETVDINLVADFICFRGLEVEEPVNPLKLQKLLYYCHAWHLVHYNTALFNEKFEAWVHGPVSKIVFYRFKESKSMYSPILEKDLLNKTFEGLNLHTKRHVYKVLDVYMGFSASQLEEITHREPPWKIARGNLGELDRSNSTISNDSIREYYKSLVD